MDSGTVAEKKLTLWLLHVCSEHSNAFSNPRLFAAYLTPFPTPAMCTGALNHNCASALAFMPEFFLDFLHLDQHFPRIGALPNFCQSLSIPSGITWIGS